MFQNLADVVRQFKRAWATQLEERAIQQICRQAKLTWRNRVLTPVLTVRLFLLQVLNGNTACAHVSHLAGLVFSAAAYCKARGRLPLGVLQTLLTRTTGQLGQQLLDTALWLGHRVFLIDGSSFSMSDTPALQKEFGQSGAQKKGCGFPVAHWLALIHAGSGMILKTLTGPLRTHDMSGASQLHPELKADDVLVGDRAFCSFSHLALLFLQGVQGLFRLHQKQLVDFTPGRTHTLPGIGKNALKKGLPRSRWIKRLGVLDQLVEWVKPVDTPDWMSAEQFAALPNRLVLRELRYSIHTPGFRVKEVTLVTTLIDSKRYSTEALAKLYGLRWKIETNFRNLKLTMNMDVLSCKTVDGVLKELTVFVLIYNLVRAVMVEASKRQAIAVDRISFIDALRWLMHARTGDELRRLVINPDRPYRFEPRVRKRRPKQYPLMTKPRREYRNALEARELMA